VLDVNIKITTVLFVPLIDILFQIVHVLKEKLKDLMDIVSNVKLLVLLVLLINGPVLLVINQDCYLVLNVSVQWANMLTISLTVLLVNTNVKLVKIMLTNVLHVKEKTEFQHLPVTVQMEHMKSLLKIVLIVVSDVKLVSVMPTIVLYVLKTELTLQLVTVHTELIILMKPYVQIVTMIYVKPVLIPQIIVSLVPVT